VCAPKPTARRCDDPYAPAAVAGAQGLNGLRRHGKPTVFWLDDLGLVESNVVYGHAIHVTEAEKG